MNKKNSTCDGSKVFDLTALKVLLSVAAISLAGMMTNASTMPSDVLNTSTSVISQAKGELLSCPVPYSTQYCMEDKIKNSCDFQGCFLPTLNLTPLMNASTKPF